MGALHDGHLELVRVARRRAGKGGSVAVSLFVNPTQFGPGEDLAKYPRTFARDKALCAEAGVDLLFAPGAAAMYPAGHSTYVEEGALSAGLCGRARPGHFRGVCTVVAKLFNLFRPDVAVFGEKDFQQLAVIRRMVRDLDFGVRIVGVPTVREADGLALSSRNRYLAPADRAEAPVIRRALLAAARLGSRNGAALERRVREGIGASARARVEYVEALDAETLGPIGPRTRRVVVAAAVRLGGTRLIDNITFRPK
jgi:pantoate--beta-alanine ligase